MNKPGVSRMAAVAMVAGAIVVSSAVSVTASTLITGKQIKDGSITGKDLANGSVASVDIRDGSVALKDLAASARISGPPGPVGPRGVQGVPGAVGPAAGAAVQRIVGDGSGNFGTSSATYVDVAPQLQVSTDVTQGDWVVLQFQANTDREGWDGTFQYFTFSVDGQDIYTGTQGLGGIVAHYNVPRSDAPGLGTGVVNMSFTWRASSTGTVSFKPRQKRSGSDVNARVVVVNNGDVNPVFTVTNLGQ